MSPDGKGLNNTKMVILHIILRFYTYGAFHLTLDG